MGAPEEELCGWGWRKLIYPDDAPGAQAAWDQAVRSGKPYKADHRIRRNDGLYYWVAARGQPVRTQDGQVQTWVGTFVEIQGQKHETEDPVLHVDTVAFQDNLPVLGYQLDFTERNRAEEDRARLTAIVQSSDDAIVGKTLSGIVTSWNEGARRLFGYTAEEMVGQPLSRLIPADRLERRADHFGALAPWRTRRAF